VSARLVHRMSGIPPAYVLFGMGLALFAACPHMANIDIRVALLVAGTLCLVTALVLIACRL
jgi:hypothetical protein